MNTYLDAIHLWLEHNTVYIGPAIALVACLESLVVVGMVLPGVAMLFALAAIAGAVSMSVYWVMFWGFLGAVIGDGISYQVGYHWQHRVRNWWPFNRYPIWLERGEAFFHNYGISSVVIGRFIGPVRPVVPAVAGMMGMPPVVFFTVNALSAIVWSPAYLVPGYLTGAALEFHEQIPRSLIVALGAIIAFAASVPTLLVAMHHRWRPNPAWHPALALVLVLLCVAATDTLSVVELHIAPKLQMMNLPWLQQEFAWLAGIASVPVLSLLFVGTLIWLYVNKRPGSLACLSLGAIATLCSIWLTGHLSGGISMATALGAYTLFSLAILLAEQQPFKIRLLSAAVATVLILLQGFASLVLQLYPLNSVLTGLGLGLFWALTVLAVRRQCPE